VSLAVLCGILDVVARKQTGNGSCMKRHTITNGTFGRTINAG